MTEKGLQQKYEIKRTDGSDNPGGEHEDCFLFVLDITHDPSAREAVEFYARTVQDTRPKLSADLYKVLDEYYEGESARTKMTTKTTGVCKYCSTLFNDCEKTPGPEFYCCEDCDADEFAHYL